MFSLAGRDFVSLKGLERAEMESVFEVAHEMEKILHARTRVDLLHDKILGLMFFQVSTRTRTSFESAMQRLGGGVVGFADPKVTRAGDYYAETLYDTVRMMESYADVLVIRHPQDFAPAEAAAATDVPVINAGDGYNEHPTQTMLDLYTIKREKGQITGMNVGFVGDMNIRGNHSLGLGLAQYQAKAYFVAPPDAKMPKPWIDEFNRIGLDYEEAESIDDVLPDLDVIFMVGVNPPSFHVGRQDAVQDRPKTPDAYVINPAKLARAKKDAIVLHPLPRKDEIPTEMDAYSAARYFVQAHYGVAVRMALLAMLLGKAP
jgi:aspartate carbamoyltransferase catalytic subunit